MTIEAGARAGLVSPDETTFDYLEGRDYVPSGRPWADVTREWAGWASDPGCSYDTLIELDSTTIEPQVTWARPREW